MEIRSRRKSRWFWLSNDFVDHGCLRWNERMLKVYLYYVRRGSGTGKCFGSLNDIADITGLDRRTVQRANAELVKAQAIHVQPGRGRGKFSVVSLLEFPGEKVTPMTCFSQEKVTEKVTPVTCFSQEKVTEKVTPQVVKGDRKGDTRDALYIYQEEQEDKEEEREGNGHLSFSFPRCIKHLESTGIRCPVEQQNDPTIRRLLDRLSRFRNWDLLCLHLVATHTPSTLKQFAIVYLADALKELSL